MQKAQPELWAKNLPLNSEFGPEVGVQKCNSTYVENMPIKTYNFYTLNTVIFQTVPQRNMKNVQDLIQGFFLSRDLRFKCIF